MYRVAIGSVICAVRDKLTKFISKPAIMHEPESLVARLPSLRSGLLEDKGYFLVQTLNNAEMLPFRGDILFS